MKKQTFIAYVLTGNNENIDFERFTCKRLETVRKNMIKLFENPLYRACTKGAKKIEVFATPDGYHKELFPVAMWDVELNG